METDFYQAMPLVETEPEEEAQQHLIAGIGNTIRNGYEHARDNLKTYAAIGASALAFSGAAELALNVEPVVADNVPAQASSLKQECVQAGLTMPQVSHTHNNPTKLFSPGRLGQTIAINVNIQPTPVNCHGIFKRIVKGVVRMQDYLNHKRLFKMGTFIDSRDVGGQSGAFLSENSHRSYDDYHCTPGPGKTRVFLELQNKIKSLKTGHIIARSPIRKRGVDVEGGNC